MSPRLVILAMIAGAAVLAGCGKTADLDRPAPMFGHPTDEAPMTKTREAAAARARADAAKAAPDDHAPQSIQELRDYTLPARKLQEPAVEGDPATDPMAAPNARATDSATPH